MQTQNKYLKGAYRKDGDNLLSKACCDRTRSNGFKPRQGRVRLDIRKKFCTMRVVKPWNRLPREVIDAPSLETFKLRLDGAHGLATMKWLSTRFEVKLRGGPAKPPPWTFGTQTLACSGRWLRGSPGREGWREKGSRQAGHSSRRQSKRHRSRLSPCATRQTGREDNQPGWTGSSWWDLEKKKESLPPMEEKAGDWRGVQGSC